MNRIKMLRQANDMRQIELANMLGIAQNTLSNWETGRTFPDPDSLKEIAKVFNTTIDYVLGGEPIVQGVIRIPVLGVVPAGIPLEAIQDIVDWEEIPQSMAAGGKEYFGLKVKGNSMYPDYLEGDTVIVRKTPTCNSGDVCIVYVNGYDATLKQVKLGADGSLTTIPRNPEYAPHTYSPQEVRDLPVSIAGIVVELRRKIK